MKTVGIIGGGVVGLCTAYYLDKAGYSVTVIDQGPMNEGCSYGNAGMLVPSHFIPLAAPGMISKGIRWMFNSRSPFYVKPRLDLDLLKWGYHFYRHANENHVKRSAPALRDLSMFSKLQYREISESGAFDFSYKEHGLMMLYQTAEAEHEETETAHAANDLGIEAKILSLEQVQELEPDVKVKARGGIYFPGDAHIVPRTFMEKLQQKLTHDGRVKFIRSAEVTGIATSGKKITSIVAGGNTIKFDEYILATGSWSGVVAKKMDLNLPMQGGKGYSFTLDNVAKNIRIPSILLEARVAVTPMNSSLRFGGTMEIGGINHDINLNRVRGIVDSIPKYYPEMKVEMPTGKIWHGLRPCSPDGLPFIGRSPKHDNLVVATGHSMLGMSLGPGTGKVVSDLIEGKKPAVGLGMFEVGRYM